MELIIDRHVLEAMGIFAREIRFNNLLRTLNPQDCFTINWDDEEDELHFGAPKIDTRSVCDDQLDALIEIYTEMLKTIRASLLSTPALRRQDMVYGFEEVVSAYGNQSDDDNAEWLSDDCPDDYQGQYEYLLAKRRAELAKGAVVIAQPAEGKYLDAYRYAIEDLCVFPFQWDIDLQLQFLADLKRLYDLWFEETIAQTKEKLLEFILAVLREEQDARRVLANYKADYNTAMRHINELKDDMESVRINTTIEMYVACKIRIGGRRVNELLNHFESDQVAYIAGKVNYALDNPPVEPVPVAE